MNKENIDKKIIDQKNILLDEIINDRRTHRKFKPEFPPENDINNIINAGLHALFAAAAVGGEKDYFRRFFVLGRDSKSMSTVASLIFDEVVTMSSNLKSLWEVT